MTTTDRASITGGTRNAKGYWRLGVGPGEPHRVRPDFVTGAGSAAPGNPLLTIGHLSDLHLCDSQSPARAEFLDRWADDDSPVKERVHAVGTYRAQDCLTVHVAEAMVRSVNAIAAGPVGGAAVDWAIATGDVTDNAQANEVGWYARLLDGGPVVPDSGDPERYEGVASADSAYWDEAFWHPDPVEDGSGRVDRPRRSHGFPDAPGLLDALRMPFDATGLAMPWLAVHGNHDQMIQGTIPAAGPFAEAAMGDLKAVGVPADWSTDAIAQFCHDVDTCQVEALDLWSTLRQRPITADAARRIVTRREFIAAHFGPTARPLGHGFAAAAGADGRAYYRYDHGQVTVLVLDTVNEHGGWQGSVDVEQLAWLAAELDSADRERRYVVLASHHPLATLVNPRVPADALPGGAYRRVLADEFGLILQGHPSLVLWLNGHTHCATVTAHPVVGGSPWWEVTAPSLIDYPQQGRLVELLRSDSGVLSIACTMIDHSGEVPWSGGVRTIGEIAGLSRELAANNWQWRTDDLARHGRVGTPDDRNVLLQLPDPF
jgi:metallophosphoesterase (TIGR03767 family)